MASKYCQIKPTGLSRKNLVDLLYMVVKSIYTLCAKLDDDAGVPMTDYEANVYTAIFNGFIEDSKGNSLFNRVSAKDKHFYHITVSGMTDAALNAVLYDIFDMMETLTEQLDTDVLSDSDYEALCYTAPYLWMITNQNGDTLGNGNTYWFNPGGMTNQKELVDCLSQIINSLDVLTQKLDADGTVTDENYEALCDTAILLLQIEDSKGNVYGNATDAYLP